tara:strand:+ start:2720 stop:3589 length:870 start_codon:yes stop_codon:yes gene_type:complete
MLSIIIPTYNDQDYLPLAIASALQLDNLGEIIVIDDCSEDGTAGLINHLKKKSNIIKYYKNKQNIGVGFSFIKGIKKSQFPYILMCNSDDFFIPKKIDKLFYYLLTHNLDLVYGKMAIQKENQIFKFSHPGYLTDNYINTRNEFRDLLIYDMYMPSFGTIIKKSCLTNFYNENYMEALNKSYGSRFKAHDYDLFLNLSKKKFKTGFLNEFVCVWNPNYSSQSGDEYFKSGEAAQESAFLFNRYYSLDDNFSIEDLEKVKKRIKQKLRKATHIIPEKRKILKEKYSEFFF